MLCMTELLLRHARVVVSHPGGQTVKEEQCCNDQTTGLRQLLATAVGPLPSATGVRRAVLVEACCSVDPYFTKYLVCMVAACAFCRRNDCRRGVLPLLHSLSNCSIQCEVDAHAITGASLQFPRLCSVVCHACYGMQCLCSVFELVSLHAVVCLACSSVFYAWFLRMHVAVCFGI